MNVDTAPTTRAETTLNPSVATPAPVACRSDQGATVKHHSPRPVKHHLSQGKQRTPLRLVMTISTTSRRPSAAAGCARLASLAVLAGQQRHHQLGNATRSDQLDTHDEIGLSERRALRAAGAGRFVAG